jgi:hypothetical protein
MRRRWLVAVLLCVLVVTAVVAYVVISPSPPARVNVGIFYYVWYGAPESDNWSAPEFVDYPVSVLGNYSSANSTVIRQQLFWIRDLGVDFVVVSWWGFYDRYGNFTDSNAKLVFKTAEDINTTLKFAVMVEPLNNSGKYDFGGIYNYIYEEFVVPYSSVYYNYDERPLICFFDNGSLTSSGPTSFNDSESRFNTVLVGQTEYVQWEYTSANCYVEPKHVPYTDEISVTPRFDDSRFRTPSCVNDSTLAEGLYDQEWKNAMQLWRSGTIHTIIITSWNEYVERTEIEPHYDATAYNHDPYFLYNKTKDYINQLQLLARAKT